MAESIKAKTFPAWLAKNWNRRRGWKLRRSASTSSQKRLTIFSLSMSNRIKPRRHRLGGPIAHGFLSLSLLSFLNAQSSIAPEKSRHGH